MCVFAGGYLTSKDRLTSNITRILPIEICCARAQTAHLAFMGCCLFPLPCPTILQYHEPSLGRGCAMKSVRIGSGAGYAGDRIEPAVALADRGDIPYGRISISR
jgi:hypothetical protein